MSLWQVCRYMTAKKAISYLTPTDLPFSALWVHGITRPPPPLLHPYPQRDPHTQYLIVLTTRPDGQYPLLALMQQHYSLSLPLRTTHHLYPLPPSHSPDITLLRLPPLAFQPQPSDISRHLSCIQATRHIFPLPTYNPSSFQRCFLCL